MARPDAYDFRMLDAVRELREHPERSIRQVAASHYVGAGDLAVVYEMTKETESAQVEAKEG